MKHELLLTSGISGDLPIDKPVERRAVCVRLAIDTHASTFRLSDAATDAERRAIVLTTAAAYEKYMRTGEKS